MKIRRRQTHRSRIGSARWVTTKLIALVNVAQFCEHNMLEEISENLRFIVVVAESRWFHVWWHFMSCVAVIGCHHYIPSSSRVVGTLNTHLSALQNVEYIYGISIFVLSGC
jgi:hypothetical protein